MTTRCALSVDDSPQSIEVSFLDLPRIGEYIEVDGEPQAVRVTRVLHQVDTSTGKASIRIDATTAIL
jgi:hypothetical protein